MKKLLFLEVMGSKIKTLIFHNPCLSSKLDILENKTFFYHVNLFSRINDYNIWAVLETEFVIILLSQIDVTYISKMKYYLFYPKKWK